jgi:branched-chain amino acid aminotransferase
MIPVTDMIVLRGYGAVDFVRTYNRKPFHLPHHLARLANSAKIIGLEMPVTLDEISEVVYKIIEKNKHLTELTLRIIITGGSGNGALSGHSNSRLLVLAGSMPSYPSEWYEQGVDVISSFVERYLPGAKSTSYLSAIVSMQKAGEKKAVESVYVDRKNRVLEGTTSNVFMVKNGEIFTAGKDILPGITRDVVIEIAGKEFRVTVKDIFLDELLAGDEVFITASTKEIVPVKSFDGQIIGKGCPGVITKRLMHIFKDYTAKY